MDDLLDWGQQATVHGPNMSYYIFVHKVLLEHSMIIHLLITCDCFPVLQGQSCIVALSGTVHGPHNLKCLIS